MVDKDKNATKAKTGGKKSRAKMAATALPEQAQIFEAFFALIAEQGWQDVTLPSLARRLNVPLSLLMPLYADKHALLMDFGRFVDEAMIAQYASDLDEQPIKEKLFDVMMQRFDVLQHYRAGIVRLINDMPRDPMAALCLGLCAGPHVIKSMGMILELSGQVSDRPVIRLLAHALTFVYLITLRAWKDDASVDMAPTMAALDRNLERFLMLSRFMR